jgi:hypothetical protein
VVHPVADGSKTWRDGRDTHIRLTVKLLGNYTVLENTEGSRRFATGCVYSGGQCLDVYCLQMKFEDNIEIKNLRRKY